MSVRILTLCILFQIKVASGQTSLEAIKLDFGPYTIGFRHYVAHDSTRTYKRIFDWNNRSIPRPIPISLWYPSDAKIAASERMTILNYMEILKDEEEWEYLPNEQILNWFYYPNTTANQDHMREPTHALEGIMASAGKYPVVVYAPSYQASSIENFLLCEYLASHGYIVISSPGRGTENRFLEGGTEKDMETQVRDLEFLIGVVMQLPNADRDQVATMGFSFGGLSNVLLQMRNRNIKAIVSLDGSVKYQFATLQKDPFFNIDNVDVPFIHMAQKDIPEQVMEEDHIDPTLNHTFQLYDSLKYSKAYRLKVNNFTHSCFSTLGVLFEPRDKRQDKSDSLIMQSYHWVSVYTLNFLNAFLKSDPDALQFLSKNTLPGVIVIEQTREPEAKAISFEDFNELASARNYNNLEGLYDSALKKDPSLEIPEGNLNNLGLQLLFNPKTSPQGVLILSFATTLYPDSANLFDSLAEAFLFIGDKAKARENFKKSLKLNPENQNAINRLKQLRE